jgi:hypothetical protein
VYVLDIKEDKKRFSVGEMMHNKDMTKYKTAYDPRTTRVFKKTYSKRTYGGFGT